MKNGKCPKCDSYTVCSKAGGIGSAIHVHTGMLTLPVEVISYVCTTCGWYENYIADEAKLADVAKKWEKVPRGGG